MERFDFLVIGAGIAGLSAAIRLADAGTVLVVTKEELAESNTAYAQGGIAVAMGGEEDVALHLEDTMAAGDGLVNREAAAVLVAQGPERVEELLQWGTAFDRKPKGQNGEGGELMRTREGAHSLSRILHANGDATGREIAVSLLRHVREIPRIELMEWTTSVDLIVEDGRVVGATLLDGEGGLRVVQARAVLLASGGAGQVYSDTTNPAVATGDGIAMAYRAGAAVSDMEFYQFHPTAFSAPGAPRFLLSEALRGEGALLGECEGRAVYGAVSSAAGAGSAGCGGAGDYARGDGWSECIWICGASESRKICRRGFRGFRRFWLKYQLELGRDLIPVRPAAHYLMGGVKTDVHGRTSLPGLYAAGEVACTGVHGANRLASNSLLEGLVFGALAAETMVADRSSDFRVPGSGDSVAAVLTAAADGVTTEAATERWIADLRALMWRHAGLLRDEAGLREAQRGLEALAVTMPRGHGSTGGGGEKSACRGGVDCGFGAGARGESRGSLPERFSAAG